MGGEPSENALLAIRSESSGELEGGRCQRIALLGWHDVEVCRYHSKLSMHVQWSRSLGDGKLMLCASLSGLHHELQVAGSNIFLWPLKLPGQVDPGITKAGVIKLCKLKKL